MNNIKDEKLNMMTPHTQTYREQLEITTQYIATKNTSMKWRGSWTPTRYQNVVKRQKKTQQTYNGGRH